MDAPSPASVLPADVVPGTRSDLFATLARIDGWGPGAWREVMGTWRLSSCLITVAERESDDDDGGAVDLLLLMPEAERKLLRTVDEIACTATADWLLRQCARTMLPHAGIRCAVLQPGASVRRTTACWFDAETERAGLWCVRMRVWLPMAGMCCDGVRYGRFIRRLERFARELTSCAALRAHERAVRIQRALRAALPDHGLVAFIAAGARLARGRDGGAARACAPLSVPKAHAVTIDLGRLGWHRGLGIRRGITAIAGAPYHGKSTLLAALAAGRDDHPPGDGRELVVCDSSVLRVQAEDGRLIKSTDLSDFFPHLPGTRSDQFATEHASGATSMAASVVQGIAAGCRLLLVDEDSAAGNFLHVDPGMRALLGKDLAGHRTLVDALPTLAASGISTVLVAGAHVASLHGADRVLLMRHFQPSDATARVGRLQVRSAPAPVRDAFTILPRVLHDDPDCWLGPRHFVQVDATEPERPRLSDHHVDLRRCGWDLDAPLVRGALAAAAWCCRLAEGHPMTLMELGERYRRWIDAGGVRELDPFDTMLLAEPPWSLVATVLERLPRPLVRNL